MNIKLQKIRSLLGTMIVLFFSLCQLYEAMYFASVIFKSWSEGGSSSAADSLPSKLARVMVTISSPLGWSLGPVYVRKPPV